MLTHHQKVKRLEELISGLSGPGDSDRNSSGRCGLLLEHLDAARRNLLGSMRGEYIFSMEGAKRSLSCISAKSLRDHVKQTIQSLVAEEPA
jgi:hypothetical protein